MILYNLKENMMLMQKEKAFLEICKELKIPVKKLEDADVCKSVGALVGNSAVFSGTQERIPKGYELPEVLIFHGLEEQALDRFLARYKERGLAPISLKAIVTPFNISWSLYQLIRELQREEGELKNK